MQAVQVTDYGGPERLALRELPVPEPAEGEVLVRMHYAGVNFIDVYTRAGDYARSRTYTNQPPFTLGREGAGVVEYTGPGVAGINPGERVAFCLSPATYAEYATVPAWRIVKVPDDMGLDVATALMLQGCTAHYLSQSLFPLGRQHTCLVHAAAGGVGQLLVQLAKLRGARVLATVGNEEKAAIAYARGADMAILYREVAFDEAVRDATGGTGVNVVYDSVGMATFERSLRCVRRRGTCVLYGGSSGQVQSVDPLDLAEAGSVFLTRPHMADYMSDAAEIGERAADMFRYTQAGRLTVHVDRVLPLAEAAAAHRILEARGTRGKLLLATAAA